ncbi:MAG: P-loop NTPase [Firmicutes bacterium]|nr:P-loop NTPase [Bacillota bacterium]
MRVCVAGGRDRAGKTTVAVNIAVALGMRGLPICLVDCNVENPAVHLLMNPAWEVMRDVVVPAPDCTPRRIGEICRGVRSGIAIVQGRLTPGQAAPSLLIRQIKESSWTGDATVLDCPGGVSEPAVESVKGCQFCILVIEATPSGLNDLTNALEMLRPLGMPYGVVVNRYDLGTREPLDYCQAKGLPVLMCIPDSDKVAELHARGIAISSVSREWQRRFGELWDRSVRTARKLLSDQGP